MRSLRDAALRTKRASRPMIQAARPDAGGPREAIIDTGFSDALTAMR